MQAVAGQKKPRREQHWQRECDATGKMIAVDVGAKAVANGSRIDKIPLPVDRDPRFADYSMRPILILNQNGYYDHTIAQLKYMMEQELLIPQKVAALHFYNTLEEFLAAIGRHLD